MGAQKLVSRIRHAHKKGSAAQSIIPRDRSNPSAQPIRFQLILFGKFTPPQARAKALCIPNQTIRGTDKRN
jgi:hypothetical protein